MKKFRAEDAIAEDRAGQAVVAVVERTEDFRRAQAARLEAERKKLVEHLVSHLKLVPVYTLPK